MPLLRNAAGDAAFGALRATSREAARKFDMPDFRIRCIPGETPPLNIGFPQLMGFPKSQPPRSQLHL